MHAAGKYLVERCILADQPVNECYRGCVKISGCYLLLTCEYACIFHGFQADGRDGIGFIRCIHSMNTFHVYIYRVNADPHETFAQDIQT